MKEWLAVPTTVARTLGISLLFALTSAESCPGGACGTATCGADATGNKCGDYDGGCQVGDTCSTSDGTPGICEHLPEPAPDGMPTTLPIAQEPCPTLATGTVSFLGSSVKLWVGPASTPGPLLFYWHGTAMTANEVSNGFSDAISEVTHQGGVVASFTSTTGSGTNTGDWVWYTGDFDVADEVLACAIQQQLVDPRHIHTAGYSAGGLQCGTMVYARSGYLASALCVSGGIINTGLYAGMYSNIYQLQDPNHIAPIITAHGKKGSDVFVVDFSDCSASLCSDVVGKGGFAINCDDGGDHILSMLTRMKTMGPVAWEFFKDHPFGLKSPFPYASGLPDYFPSYCSITQ
jgi:poly(3-hydroxybutyrate) depolymerase